MSKYTLRTHLNSTNYHHENLGGKQFLVVPAVPVREQVMNTYYVPAEELEFAEMWNGTPITIRHPQKNNGSVNVPNPDVHIIGRFYNGKWDSGERKLVGEYWIDIEEAAKSVEGQYILNAIYANKVLETSTGYWAEEEFATGVFDNREYETIQHNLKPDHIAILVDKVGACSVADGCGVNRNSLVFQLHANAELYTQGGIGSGDFGHGGRPGSVGGSSPGNKPAKKGRGENKLKQPVTAYYVTTKENADKYKNGIKTKTSLMTQAKAEAMFTRMQNAGNDPVVLEVHLRRGTEYDSITASSITVRDIPGSEIKIITFDTLTKRKGERFSNEENCIICPDLAANEESLTDTIEKLRTSFYEEFMKQESMYIVDYFDGYCIVNTEDGMYKVEYMEADGGVVFAERQEWIKVERESEYVETDTVQDNARQDLPASYYLVVDSDGKKHLQVKDASGNYDHRLCGAAWAALHGGYRGQKYEGEGKQEALKKLKAIYKRMKWDMPMMNAQITIVPIKSNALITLKGGDAIASSASNKGRLSIKNMLKGVDMKAKVKDLLASLLGAGLQVNAEGVDDELEVEIGSETPAEPPAAPVAANAQQAKPVFNEQEIDALRNILKMDWTQFNAIAEKVPAILEVAQNAEAERTNKRTELIALIKNNADNVFTDEELAAMTLPMLTKLNARMNVDFSGLGGAVIENAEEDEVLGLPVYSTKEA